MTVWLLVLSVFLYTVVYDFDTITKWELSLKDIIWNVFFFVFFLLVLPYCLLFLVFVICADL